MCKAYICETAFEVCSQLQQMWGGNGIITDTGVHRYMRDARTNMIAEGVTEMHHAVIASALGFDISMMSSHASLSPN